MIWEVEVLSNCIFCIFGCNIVQVTLEAIHEPTLGLVHMSDFTIFCI